MSYYTANVKLYENSSGAIGTSGNVLAFNANDVVPDATVTANSLLTGGLVTLQTGGGAPVPTFPVTVVGTPANTQVPVWNTTTHQWEPGAGGGTSDASIGSVQAEATAHALRLDNVHGVQFNQLVDPPMATPEDHGFLGWTFDPKDCSATASLSAGTIFLVRARLRKESAISSVLTNYSSGASVTGAYVGVYTLAAGTLTLEGVSAESHAAIVTGGDQTIALTAATRVMPAGQVIWVAFLNTGAAASVPTAGSTFRNNIGMAAATGWRFATFGAGKSTLDTTITASSASSNNNNIFAAVL